MSKLEPNITTRRTLITPALAATMLEAAPEHQRHVSDAVVAAYVVDMKAGRWHENAETIKLDTDGNLLDGQHRLTAVVESKTEQYMLVARGVDKSTFSTIDIGRKRTPGDIFAIAGVTNGVQKAALAKMLLTCELSHRSGVISIRKTPASTSLAYAQKHVNEVDLAYQILAAIRSEMGPPAPIAAALAYLHRFNEKAAAAFTAAIVDGVGLKARSPELLLRRRLCTKESGSASGAARRIAEVVSMFGAYVRGLDITHMIPLNTNDDGVLVMPIVYTGSNTGIDWKGNTVAASTAKSSRGQASPKAKAKGGKQPRSRKPKLEVAA